MHVATLLSQTLLRSKNDFPAIHRNIANQTKMGNRVVSEDQRGKQPKPKSISIAKVLKGAVKTSVMKKQTEMNERKSSSCTASLNTQKTPPEKKQWEKFVNDIHKAVGVETEPKKYCPSGKILTARRLPEHSIQTNQGSGQSWNIMK